MKRFKLSISSTKKILKSNTTSKCYLSIILLCKSNVSQTVFPKWHLIILDCGFREKGIYNTWAPYLSYYLVLIIIALLFLGLSFSLNEFFLINTLEIKINFRAFNSIPVIIVLIISSSVFLWARFYIKGSRRLTLFKTFLFSFVFSIILLLFRDRLFIIFLGWEGLGITSFVLIIFYQNWARFNGGVLTILTNRIGDALLIIRYSYWLIINRHTSLKYGIRALLVFIFTMLTFTKSAQLPFTSWLPAAIAAPTPVRSLVHRSTLVTAGVWLLIKYGSRRFLRINLWFCVGRITISLARIAALVELDGKKVVALSTLSQLGLIVLSLSIGGYYICLFHLAIHAFAKANLFLVVGNQIHSRFSLQDIRLIKRRNQEFVISLIIFIRLLRLSGVFFLSGFFSKEFILIRESSTMNSIITFIVFIVVITITLVYCLKLFFILMIENEYLLQEKSSSLSKSFSPLRLRVITVFTGWIFSKNLNLIAVSLLRGTYWFFLFRAGIYIFSVSFLKWGIVFQRQISLNKIIRKFLLKFRQKTIYFSINSLFESNYLITTHLLSRNLSFLARLVFFGLGTTALIFL